MGLVEGAGGTGKRAWMLRAVWPNAWDSDADGLARQGFWICSTVAAYQIWNWWGSGSLKGPAMSFAFYFVGACGVRSRSWFAASLLLAWDVLGQVGDALLGLHPHVQSSLITLLLILTLRNTWIASRRPSPVDFSDLVAAPLPHGGFLGTLDRFAIGVWKLLRWPFLPFAFVLVVLCTVGTVMTVRDPASGVAIEDGKTFQDRKTPSR